MSIFFCNIILVSLLYVHVKRTGGKIRPRPKTVILKMKTIQKIQRITPRQTNGRIKQTISPLPIDIQG